MTSPPLGPIPDSEAATDGRAGAGLVASLRAHPLLVAVVTLAALLAGLAWSATRDPVYEASAQVLVTPLTEADRGVPPRLPLLRGGPEGTRVMQTAASLIDTPGAASATARAMGGDWTAERVSGAVDVEPQGESDVLAVTARADDPAPAARLANEFARAALAVRADALRPILTSLTEDIERELRAQRGTSSPVSVELAGRLADLRALGTGRDPTLFLSRRAEAPTSPIGQPRWLLAGVALLAGLGVGLGSAMVVDMLVPRLRDASHAVAVTRLPVLARVPARGLLDRPRPGSVAKVHPGAIAALRTLQHQLELHPAACRRVLFTGGSEGDGATTCVAALALTVGNAGHDVLLVDLDTDAPQLAARLGAPTSRPLSAVRASGEPWEEAVAGVPGAPRVEVLTVSDEGAMGMPDELAAELPQVLEEACKCFEYVLVDAPPLATAGEALRVLSAVDAVVLALRPASTRLADLETALDALEHTGTRPDGLVFVGGRGAARAAAYTPDATTVAAPATPAVGRTVRS